VQIPKLSNNPAIQKIVEQANAAFKKMPALGPVVWLLGRMPGKQHLFMADLDWAVLPPLVLDQCRLFMNGDMPFGYISWAFVNDEVHARLMGGNTRLQPHEWHGGENAWLIDLVMPFGEADKMLAELKQSTFSERTVHYLGLTEDGRGLVPKTL
jgi:cytolysin-activating lysine-acyltransferase